MHKSKDLGFCSNNNRRKSKFNIFINKIKYLKKIYKFFKIQIYNKQKIHNFIQNKKKYVIKNETIQ